MSHVVGSRANWGPKYLQIYDDLAARIVGGEWSIGSALPSQRELSEQYDVTLMTLHQALQLLEDERVVVTEPGKGTFVAPIGYNYDLGHLRSFSHDMQTQGASLRTEVLSTGLISASEATACRLGLSSPGEVYEVRRLRHLDEEPVVLHSSHVAPEIGRLLDAADLGASSVYQALAVELRVEIVRATETIRPVILSPDDAALLRRARHTGAGKSSSELRHRQCARHRRHRTASRQRRVDHR